MYPLPGDAEEADGPRLQTRDREELIKRAEAIMVKPELPTKVMSIRCAVGT